MPESIIVTIPQIRLVVYNTYANFPAANAVRIGDLGYATDRLVFYRSDGTNWQEITIHSSSGTAANIPAAADMPEGSIYYATDTAVLSQIQSGAWVAITAAPLTLCEVEVFAGSSPNPHAFTDLNLSGTVGARATFVILRCYNPNAAAQAYAFRPNGETEMDVQIGTEFSPFICFCGASKFNIVIGLTDPAGILEWHYPVNDQAGCIIDLIGFIR